MPATYDLLPPEACLVSHIAEHLTQLATRDFRGVTVVLPTKRLATWLTATLTKQLKAVIPPRCLTWSELLRSFSVDEVDLEDEALAFSPLEEEFLLETLIRQGAFRHIQVGHVHEIRQFFNEIHDCGILAVSTFGDLLTPSLLEGPFKELLACVEQDIYHSDQTVSTLAERFIELSALYQQFITAGVQDRRGSRLPDALRHLLVVRRLSRDLTALPPGTRQLVIAGLTSVKPAELAVVKKVASLDGVHFVFAVDPLAPKQSPLTELIETVVPGFTPMATVEPAMRQLEIHSLPTEISEVAHALTIIRDEVAAGALPSSLAILVSDDTAYGEKIRLLSRHHSLTANIALTTPLRQTSIGAIFRDLFAVLAAPDDTLLFLALLEHPLIGAFAANLSPEDLWSARSHLFSAYEQLAVAATPERLAQVAESAVARTLVHKVLGFLRPFHDVATAPSSVWMSLLGRLAQDLLSAHSQTLDSIPPAAADLERSAEEQVRSFFRAISDIGDLGDTVLSLKDVLSFLSRHLLTADVRGIGDQLHGVQILSISEARFVPFKKVLILGATEGRLPRALPKDYLVDQYFKQRLGLPGWQVLEAIENTTFNLLRARIPSLVLSYPEDIQHSQTVRSRFIEELLARGAAEVEAFTRDDDVARLIGGERGDQSYARRLGVQGDARNIPLSSVMSASSIEVFLHCPYRYLLERLGVKPYEWPRDDDPRVDGEWAHRVLETFLKTFAEQILPRVTGTLDLDEFKKLALTRLSQLTDECAPEQYRGDLAHPARLTLLYDAWPKYVDHLCKLFPGDALTKLCAGTRELPVRAESGEPITVTMGDSSIKLRGKIDALDFWDESILITDYKRTGFPSKSKVLSGKAPQLLVYARAASQLFGSSERVAVAYYSIYQGEFKLIAHGADFNMPTVFGRKAPPPALPAAQLNLDRLFNERAQSALGADALFPPLPEDLGGHCRHCGLANICRKDDREVRDPCQ